MVFVYGTLKRGFPNHSLLVASATPFVGAASTAGPASLIIGPYSVPFLLPTPASASSGRVVSGELYAPSPAALAELDALEASASPPHQTRCSLSTGLVFPHLMPSICRRAPTSASTSGARSPSWSTGRARWCRRRRTSRTRATRRRSGGAAAVRRPRLESTPWTMPASTSRRVSALPTLLGLLTPSIGSSPLPRTTDVVLTDYYHSSVNMSRVSSFPGLVLRLQLSLSRTVIHPANLQTLLLGYAGRRIMYSA
jgi:gamma-glutamylcyclotransferase (GGCT)/AIG2-like uncharacterized protein YtfP